MQVQRRPGPGLIVRQKRRAMDLTQDELAQKVGYSRQSIAAIERGTMPLPLTVAKDMAEVFGCTLDELAG